MSVAVLLELAALFGYLNERFLRLQATIGLMLLAHSALAVGEIAAALGYADPGSFSRFFLRLAGTPPGAYRARARSRQE